MSAGAQDFGSLSAAFLGHKQEIESGVEQPGLEQMLICDVDTISRRLACHANVLAAGLQHGLHQ